jgi:hypothetical protein
MARNSMGRGRLLFGFLQLAVLLGRAVAAPSPTSNIIDSAGTAELWQGVGDVTAQGAPSVIPMHGADFYLGRTLCTPLNGHQLLPLRMQGHVVQMPRLSAKMSALAKAGWLHACQSVWKPSAMAMSWVGGLARAL